MGQLSKEVPGTVRHGYGILTPLERCREDRIAGQGPSRSAHLTPMGKLDSDEKGHLPDECGHYYDQPVKVSAFARIAVRFPSNRCPLSFEFVSALRRAPQRQCNNANMIPMHQYISRRNR